MVLVMFGIANGGVIYGHRRMDDPGKVRMESPGDSKTHMWYGRG